MIKDVSNENQAKFFVNQLKEFCKKNDAQGAVLIHVDQFGVIHTTTYGDSKKKCHALYSWGRGIANNCLSIIPFRTMFGWGNDGIPCPLNAEEQIEYNQVPLVIRMAVEQEFQEDENACFNEAVTCNTYESKEALESNPMQYWDWSDERKM